MTSSHYTIKISATALISKVCIAEITDYQELEKIFKNFLPDIVIHNAAISNPQTAAKVNPKIVYEINVTCNGENC